MAESNPSAAGASAAITPAALDEALSRDARLPAFPLTVERLQAMWKENA